MPPKLLDRLVLTLVYLLTHAHVLKRAVGALTVPGIEVAFAGREFLRTDQKGGNKTRRRPNLR